MMQTQNSPRRRMGARTVRAVAAHELRQHLRGRLIPVFAALFTALCVGVALTGLAASGELLVQGFTRTGASLLEVALYLLPLLGVVLGATAFAGDDAGTELLLAQPVGRDEVLFGRVAGLAAGVALIALAGFGGAGLLIAVGAGLSGLGGYAVVAAGTTLVALAGLGVGALIGGLAPGRLAAVGWALAAWLAAAVLYDLLAIGLLQVMGAGEPGPWLVALLAANPIDGVRTLGLVALGADTLMGPTGAALNRMLGEDGGALWIAGSVTGWLALPLVAAAALFRRRDF